MLLISAGFTTKKQAPKDNISLALFHPSTFFFSMFTKTERGRSFQGWLAPRSRLSHACFRGTKSGQSIGHRNQSVRRCCLSRCVHPERNQHQQQQKLARADEPVAEHSHRIRM